jgi:hypothetical protein
MSIAGAQALLESWGRQGLLTIDMNKPIVFIGTPRISLGPVIDGVKIQGPAAVGAHIGQIIPVPPTVVDPRFAVFLVRLVRYLKCKWGIVALEHMSIVRSSDNCAGDDTKWDVHTMGRAIDFSGVVFKNGTSLHVEKDWGNKPAPYPTNATTTKYRLTPSDPGYQLFLDLYRFTHEEGSDAAGMNVGDLLYKKTQPANGPIGSHSYIVTPDHPDPALRVKHQNHVHMQIGPTCISK